MAAAVAATITDTLLTTADIKGQAEILVTKQNIYLAIDSFINSVLKEFRDTTKLHRLASDIAELSPTVLEHLVVSIIDGAKHGHEQRLTQIIEKIFDLVILRTHFTRTSRRYIDTLNGIVVDAIKSAQSLYCSFKPTKHQPP